MEFHFLNLIFIMTNITKVFSVFNDGLLFFKTLFMNCLVLIALVLLKSAEISAIFLVMTKIILICKLF